MTPKQEVQSLGSAVVHRVSRKRHKCSPPGWWGRRKLDIDFGSVWACECGAQWKWDFNYASEFWEAMP